MPISRSVIDTVAINNLYLTNNVRTNADGTPTTGLNGLLKSVNGVVQVAITAGGDYLDLPTLTSESTVVFQGVVTAPLAGPVASPTTTYAATLANRVILGTSAGAWALALPSAATVPAGFELIIKKTDSAAHAITVTANGSDKIDGSGTYALSAQYKYVYLVCDGSANWNIVGSN